MPKSVTRIISDLHYTDPMSWVQDLSALRPLVDGVTHLIINGDSMDTQLMANPQERVAELKSFVGEHVPRLTNVTGNHDPDISDIHEVSLAGGAVWATHGDVFFDEICPWSRLLPEIRRRLRQHAPDASPEELKKLEMRFRLFRQVCLKLPPDHNPHGRGMFALLRKMAGALFPPHRIFVILKVWREFPALAASVSAAQRPAARVIINGHTHFQGVWRRRDERTVVNTGSFCPPRGGLLVDLIDDAVVVRTIERSRGEFRPGQTIAQLHAGLLPRHNPLSSVP